MFAKGPMPGATPRDDAMAVLPAGTTCQRINGGGMSGYVVELPDGTQVGSGGNSNTAWRNALSWAVNNPRRLRKFETTAKRVPKPIGRPPGTGAPPELQRKTRSIRLNDERWEKLQRLGSSWLEQTLDNTPEP